MLLLYDLFQAFCSAGPKVENPRPDKRTGKVSSAIFFYTYALPCFNELYDLFYPNGQKVVPLNIADLLTPIGLAYWIADDGSWDKMGKYVVLSTNSFPLPEVELLIETLNQKFDLRCYKCRQGKNYRIIIPSYSIPN